MSSPETDRNGGRLGDGSGDNIFLRARWRGMYVKVEMTEEVGRDKE